MVTGATGGTGACTVMCALACGAARVIAVARNRERLQKLKALAPKRIVTLSSAESLREKILKITENQGAGVLIDFVPNDPETLQTAFACVQRGGRIVPMGRGSEALSITLDQLTRNGWEVLGSTAAHLSDMADLVELVRFGALDLSGISARTFPLEKANEALQTVLDRPSSDIFCVGVRLGAQ